MTDLIVVPQAPHWQRLKALVLDSVSSPITRRVYNLGLDEFFEWFGQEPRPGFTKMVHSRAKLSLYVALNPRWTAFRVFDSHGCATLNRSVRARSQKESS